MKALLTSDCMQKIIPLCISLKDKVHASITISESVPPSIGSEDAISIDVDCGAGSLIGSERSSECYTDLY